MSVPLSIELLFDNEKLDLIKTMGLLYACFTKQEEISKNLRTCILL